MDRRQFLTTSSAVVGAVTLGLGTNAFAKSSKEKSHSSEDHHNHTQHMISSALHCIGTAYACISHCQAEAPGNKTAEMCTSAAMNMIIVCDGLVKLAAHHSSFLKTYAQVCIEACRQCIECCEAHISANKSEHMAVCQACIDACKQCIRCCEEA